MTNSQQNLTRSSAITEMHSQLGTLSKNLEPMAKIIPPGPQRIRGIAGSGKTVLLCQKAAYMHLQNPDWDIALVFFTRSLYDLMEKQVNKWLKYFSDGKVQYDKRNSKLKVFHAWGTDEKNGLYRKIRKAHNFKPEPHNYPNYSPPEQLAKVVIQLLEAREIQPMFDAILIDEGQDLVVRDELKFKGKQPIYWLAWQALRPVNSEKPQQKRLIWAYDEAQSLHSLKIPTAKELFGEELSDLVKGIDKGAISKSIIMKQCFRTPHSILTAAHGIGMGLFRSDGMLSRYTNKKDWEKIGYQVEGSFNNGQKITLSRPPENYPNPLPEIWKKPVLEFNIYKNREAELTALSDKIKYNLEFDKLNPSRNILVIVLGSSREEAMALQKEVGEFLIQQNINIYISSASNINDLERNDRNRNQFWHEAGITISLIHRAKGNEADMVYVIGVDKIAENESNINLRNALFVALTRARGWAVLSGIDDYPMYQEIRQVIDIAESGKPFTFTYKRSPQWNLNDR
ncbi:DEAD/DEAH box helicase [Okeania sp. KiyG1]|uniref:DEAD/DEAH box helicase n=1 Tax=Okeania sp. KiyG1 TaxID=2720165 RepID=UPI0019AD419B|nr:ATP-binding domain-containing protein [Okeania sp. KiyG1]GFZ96789.1 hypothetical protein CYANOKiyG1_07900 [Okeania sp. KiyG1]